MIAPIFWLTGNCGAGKTTLAKGFERHWNKRSTLRHPWARRVLVLDGDEMRATISTEDSLSANDRRRHNLRVARLASLMQAKGFVVIVAVIAPFADVRKEIDALCHPVWIYLKRSTPHGPDRPYEAPKSPAQTIDNDCLSKSKALMSLLTFTKKYQKNVLKRKC